MSDVPDIKVMRPRYTLRRAKDVLGLPAWEVTAHHGDEDQLAGTIVWTDRAGRGGSRVYRVYGQNRDPLQAMPLFSMEALNAHEAAEVILAMWCAGGVP